MDRIPYIAVLLAYGLVGLAHLHPGIGERLGERVRTVAWTGVVLHGLALLLRMVTTTIGPGFPEAISAGALGIMGAYALAGKGRLSALGLLLAPLATVLLGTALVVPHRQVAALEHSDAVIPWLPVHLGLVFFGIASFALSFAVAVLYLLVRRELKNKRFDRLGRLPSLEVLDSLQFRATLFGFGALTLGIGVGGGIAAVALDEPWAWDPKVGFSLLLWAWYGASLQLRLVGGWRGKWAALFAIVGFAGALFSLLGLNFVSTGWHGYGG
ncbi:MAG: c-type cytochrome biogenesis protein CcsB [Deltaproteobacteria bacterium]|nr:MAG: c-type cytochrome biogenesis protein CcsB [Deltaproteobacteria bacterium]